jgi:putative zinc finger/helix-turn-helix YgiT family protein
MEKPISVCPECEKGRLKEIKKDLLFTYKGQTKRFMQMRVLSCPVCGHERLPEESSDKVDRELTDFRRSVDGLLRGHELRAIRLELGLKIKEMADRLSLDAKTVGRYENGKITQSKQVDMLYRGLLTEHLHERRLFAEQSTKAPLSSAHFLMHGESLTVAGSSQVRLSQKAPFRVKVSSMYFCQPSGATVDKTYFRLHESESLPEDQELAA